jgi:KUP system potassium uptake protein
MAGNRTGTPLSLLHNLKHNKVLHEQVILLNVRTEETPYLADEVPRAEVEQLGKGVWRAQLHYGFMEQPDVPAGLATVDHPELQLDPLRTTYFVGRETILSTTDSTMPHLRGALFAWMTRNSGDVTSHFRLPPNAVVELGARVEV